MWKTMVLSALLCLALPTEAQQRRANPAEPPASPYARWKNGPPTDPRFFPIGVWLQDPGNAARYKAIGINLYVGLWQGPTEEQLEALDKAGLAVICQQNDVGLRRLNDGTVIGWMHPDEPDNAQPMGTYWKSATEIKREWPDAPDRTLEQWGRYGPPIPPRRLIADYERMRKADPSRPVFVNFGQSVAWEGTRQRGVRRGHPEDYREYVKGADILSYDIYPGLHTHPDVAGKLYLTARGVDRLTEWSGESKVVWNVIEAAHTVRDNPKKATPHQVRAQVWMSLIHGSRGIIYIVHQFAPEFVEAGVFNDTPEDRLMLRELAALNARIRELAPVLNSPTIGQAVTVALTNQKVPVSTMFKRQGGASHLFAVAMREGTTMAEFRFREPSPGTIARVVGENREVEINDGALVDRFGPYEVHVYEIR